MRAVVDTNILVSGLMSAGSPPARVLAAMVSGRLRPVLCAEIVAEYRDVLARPHLRMRRDHVAELLVLLAQTADWVAIPAYNGAPPMPDVDDWPFFAAAHVANCPMITGNLKHFPADLGVRVMTAREWVDGAPAA